MRKPLFLLLIVVAAVGGWYFFNHYEIAGIDRVTVKPRAPQNDQSSSSADKPPVQRPGDTIRIASFNIQVFGKSKLSKTHVMDRLAQIVRQFDLVAIQEIRSKDQGIVPQFVDLINAADRQYDYVIGPRLGRTSSKEQYAFVFDTASVEVDRDQLYTVDDQQDDVLHREPLVGWFRVRGPPADEAFTFTLVNIHTDPDEVEKEVNALDDVYRAVRDDGRGEDDVIVLGDLNADDQNLGQLGRLSGITCAISRVPSNTRRTKLYDNLVFSRHAVTEYTGRSGVFDFMRQFNLTLEAALEISDHLPVWAEFSVYEGGQPGRIATLPKPAPK